MIEPGTLFQITVGMPGPDMENAIILSKSNSGYIIARCNYITGEITEEEYTNNIIPGIRYPNQNIGIDGLMDYYISKYII